MRQIKFLSALALTLILITSCTSPQQKLTTAVSSLRPRINEGDTLEYEIELVSNSIMYIDYYQYPEIIYFGKAKIYTIVTGIEGDSISFKSGVIDANATMRAREYRLSSRYSSHQHNPIGFLEDLKGKEWEYTMTPSGLTESSDENALEFLAILLPFLPPEEPVTLGTSWEVELEKGRKVFYRFSEMKGDDAILEYKYHITTTLKSEEIFQKSDLDEINIDENYKAKVILNTKIGKVTEIKIDSSEKRTANIDSHRLKILIDTGGGVKVIR